MMNAPVYIFDNIGCFFIVKDNKFYCYQNIPGYNNLSQDHIGSYIPYIVRNASSDNVEWEVGIGLIKADNDNKIFVERYEVLESSNDNKSVNFSNNGKKTFYVFANQSNFNTAFNNIVLRDSSFDIDNVKCVYLVDTSAGEIEANLPDAEQNKSLTVELKIVSGDGLVNINQKNEKIYSLRGLDKYISLISDGEKWVVLNTSSLPTINSSFSSLSQDYGALAAGEASAPTGSLQYNNNGTIDGTNIYWGANNKLLLGSNSEASAQTILPSSGNFDNVFNRQKNISNFIVNGSGVDKNLYFAYDGRLGLNIPSGSTPQTLLHLVNTSCRQAIRVENRSTCTTPNITLFHKPSSTLNANSDIGSLTFAGRDNAVPAAEVSYVKLEGTAVSASAGSTRGEFSVSVENNGSFIETLKLNPTGTKLGYNDNSIVVNSGGTSVIGYPNSNITVSNNSIILQSTGVSLQTPLVNVLGLIQSPSGSITNLTVNNLKLSNLSGPSNLGINNNGELILSSGFSFPAIPSGRVLTTSTNGSVTGVYEISDFFLTNKDISWSRYPTRQAVVCVKQVVFSSEVSMEEFEVGDQIAIIASDTTYFRTITDRDVSTGVIASLLINQNIPSLSSSSDVEVYSITRGGVFLIEPYIDPSFGVVADATANILSVRPGTDTVFNTKQKDIDFYVYGTSPTAAITVKAKYGSEIISSGVYNEYATLDSLCETNKAPFPMNIDSNGSGLSNQNNTANFKSIAIDTNWSGMVSAVGSNGQPSYYGTYDQNGNLSEWIEDSNEVSLRVNQYVAGGSWSSDSAIKLKSIESLVASSGYDNVGFRISSSYGLLDTSYVTGVLGLSFIDIGNTNNSSDNNTFYQIVNNNAIATGIVGLGSVSHNYRISKYEITNNQYVKFLNAINKTQISGLYDSRMTSSFIGGINISGTNGSYTYSTKSGMNDMPVAYINYLSSIRFTNWLHNGSPTGTMSDIYSVVNSGAYNIAYEDINQTSPIVTKNTYQKYWLPSLNEWHKAAYYRPTQLVTTGDMKEGEY
jgi:formylglycine-generating enzyme required for sulfatase activity